MKLVFVFVAAFLLYTAKIFSAEANSINLRVMTYNIKGLPPIATPGWGIARFKTIAERLKERLGNGNGPDIIVLQEVFTTKAAELVPLSGYNHSAQGPTRDGSDADGTFQKFFSAGIYIMSRYPIVESGQVNYVKGVCATWDCNANKGLQYVKIAVPGLKEHVTVFNTHMQSGKANDMVRISQMETMATFLLTNLKSDDIFIFGGDFNTSPELPSFSVLKDTLKAQTAGEFCVTNSASCRLTADSTADDVYDSAIDHIFFKGTDKYSIVPLTVQRSFTEIYGDKPLSDHMASEALFSIKKIKKLTPHKSHKAVGPTSKIGA